MSHLSPRVAQTSALNRGSLTEPRGWRTYVIQFNEDGTLDIDFPQGKVTVRPPTFGGMKRLRADRTRFAQRAADEMRQWEIDHPAPPEDAEVADLARHAENRLEATEATNLAASVDFWKLVLLGDETFQKLADGPVPSDPDDWPASLLYDFRAIVPKDATVEQLLGAQPLPDQWFRHVGNSRSRSGVTAGAGLTTP